MSAAVAMNQVVTSAAGDGKCHRPSSGRPGVGHTCAVGDSAAVTILVCEDCGDTFPVRDPDGALCPTCGSAAVAVASEPLL